jgi:hypothetical protein
MSVQLILMGLGLVTVALLIEDLFDAIWNAVAVRRRKAEEDARLDRIERIVADARRTGTPVVVEERGGLIDVIGTGESLSHEVSEVR